MLPSPLAQAALMSQRRLPCGTLISFILTFITSYFITSLRCKLVSLSAHPELDRLRVVLVSPRNPLNIGAAARAMSNFDSSIFAW